jgi:plastocyanin/mono/diheme cytochrome c family protein
MVNAECGMRGRADGIPHSAFTIPHWSEGPMNTSKQINAMIVLMSLLLVGIGAYTIWDPFRAEDEEEHTKELITERAAHTFARNCRVCHGNEGEGRIGPALNPQARKVAGLADFADPSKLKENQALVKNTLICGRIGKIMPPWSQEQGGSLSDEQIRQLTILITENPGGNAWATVGEISAEENKVAPLAEIADVTKGAAVTGGGAPVCGQKAAVAATPTPTPPPSTTTVTLTATDNKFDLAAISVPSGQQVTLTLNNRGAATHNFSVTIGSEKVETKLLSGGQSETARFTATQTGAFEFQCSVHPQDMKGILFVQ